MDRLFLDTANHHIQPITHHFSAIHRLPSCHSSCPLSSNRRFTPYDIQPQLTYTPNEACAQTKPDSDRVHPTQSLHRLPRRSSSSAIFEWDIEPPVIPSPPTLPHHPPNPHRVSRAKSTEQLEQSVPSVLDSAASILASIDDSHAEEQVSVEAPASRSSGFASPLSFRSRSLNPLGVRNVSAVGVPVHNHLLSPTTIPPVVAPHSPTQLPAVRSTIQTRTDSATATVASMPSLVTPTSAYFSTTSSIGSSSSSSSPTTTTAQEHPLASLPEPNAPFQHASNTNSPNAGFSPLLLSSHPPSPTHAAKKRLSFMSFSDLLSSTPTSTLPLSSLTTSASTFEPPPHIPGVSGLGIVSGGGLTNERSSIRGGVTHPGKRDSIALLDNVGGERERQGLGMGLEERLDAVLGKA
ncbi:uncharacterized protein LACBIDRAFT_295556 [Laccaria bicolor S238N-H82]|uniref:Predicted protein n=1 Tax=Laccaria bicolor (strain S238N-H82 / ATCC MYA-4686) TaxID=486041 RepID=B0DUP0_LACBS|nr:uncharacterized protein LACBIDRAFT_295556 [Laccaria bicolor S238N-H82]EDR01574.1 predicted protein [Laccaria bicolor S238N-H82]|eukprot:XP_001887650.1 predicted protein [Laccaria bicolor S238N-H82]